MLNRLIEDLRFFIGFFFLIVSVLLIFEGLTVEKLTAGYNLNLVSGCAFLVFSLGALALSIFSQRKN
jgi:hypothetical protein